MRQRLNHHLNIIKNNRKTTFVGLAVLAGTGIKWGLGAPSPSDIPTVASSLVEVLIGFGLLMAKDYDVVGVANNREEKND